MKLFRINSLLTALRALLGWPLLVIGGYMMAAFIGSHIPANPGWNEPVNGVEIYVETNGVHVSLILPIAGVGEDLSNFIRPDQLSNPDLFGTHAMIGWGHKGVYRNAETWGDVKSGDVSSAIFGSDDTTLHVYHLINPKALPHRRMLRISAAQYRAIVAQVRKRFLLDPSGHSIAHSGYGLDNIFYDSTGHYDAFNTCNTWTGSILKNAGVRIGMWTPLPGGVMRWF